MQDEYKGFKVETVIWLLLVADIILVVQSLFYVFRTDLIQCDYARWVMYMKEHGFLSIYHAGADGIIESGCDYPPIYIYFLWLVVKFDQGMDSTITNTLLKACPYTFFFISQAFIYRRLSKEAAVMWTVNLAFILNCAVWGQRDVAFGFLLIGMFYSFYKKQRYWPSIWYALLCLLKQQGCLFLPCYLIYMFVYVKGWRTRILSIASGMALGIAAYLPFMLKERTFQVFFNVYGVTSDTYLCSIETYAPNLYAIHRLYTLPFNWFWMVNIGLTLVVLIVYVVVFCKTHDLIFSSMIYTYLTFMMCLGQHERYALYYVFFVFFYYHMFGKMYDCKFRAELERVYWLGSLAAFIAQLTFVMIMEPTEMLRVKYGFPFDAMTVEHKRAFYDYCATHSVVRAVYECRLWFIFLGTVMNVWNGYTIFSKLYPEVKKQPVDLGKF